MNFDPNEANEVMLPEAWYDAEILEAKDKKSSAGNDMMEVLYAVYASASPEHVYDYFVQGNQSSMSRMKKFCFALGLEAQFNKGAITPDMVKGKPIKLFIKTQKPKEGSQYGPKNVASKYADPADPTATNGNAANVTVAAGAPSNDPDIPF